MNNFKIITKANWSIAYILLQAQRTVRDRNRPKSLVNVKFSEFGSYDTVPYVQKQSGRYTIQQLGSGDFWPVAMTCSQFSLNVFVDFVIFSFLEHWVALTAIHGFQVYRSIST